MQYPENWPKPSYGKPKAVTSRITEAQKADLYARRVTTRALAATLEVNESYLSSLFPTKEAPQLKTGRLAIEARKAFRAVEVTRVLRGDLEVGEAAFACKVSYRTMARAVQQARKRIALRQSETT